jgi:hypothetical protein
MAQDSRQIESMGMRVQLGKQAALLKGKRPHCGWAGVEEVVR